MWASDWTAFYPCATRLRTRLINHKESIGKRLAISFGSFSLHELDLAYACCFQCLPLHYFAFKAIILKDKGEGGGMFVCVWEERSNT